MKNLQKTNLNKQLKIEKFLKEQLWQLLLITAFVCACAWLFDRWIVALLSAKVLFVGSNPIRASKR